MSRYVDPLIDFSFKRLFGVEPNKDLLIDFLNAVFEGNRVIEDVVYTKNEYVGDTETIGSVVFDLICTDKGGSIFLIEIQRTNQYNIKNRMLYYASKLITDQARRGKRSAWNYKLQEVFIIVLLDGFTLNPRNTHQYLYRVGLCNQETGAHFYDRLGFVYIELRNFNKESDDLKTNLDKWLYVLKNLAGMNTLPIFLRKHVFIKLFKLAEYSKMNKEDRAMYDVNLKRQWDAYNVKETARLEGLEEGREKGREEGREEEALKNIREKLSIAQKLKIMGLPIPTIIDVTGLSAEVLKDLH